jgi:LAO/AO transport system kinase
MVDFFLLLMLAGAGDELQGIKRGIMEMADGIVINKADGDNMQQALLAKNQYANALHLFPKAPSSWETKTAVCSSLNANGIQEVWRMIEDYHGFTLENGYFNQKRQDQNLQTLKSRLKSSLEEHFNNDPSIRRLRKHIEDQVVNQKRSPYQAADELMQAFLKK